MIKYSKITSYILTFIIFVTLFVNVVGILNSSLNIQEKVIELLLNGLFVFIIIIIFSSFIRINNNFREYNCMFITNNGRGYFYFFYLFSIFLTLLYFALGISTIILNWVYPAEYAYYYIMMVIGCSFIPKISIKGFIYYDNSYVFLGINKIRKSDIKNVKIIRRKIGLGYNISFILGGNKIQFDAFSNSPTKENIIKTFVEQEIPFSLPKEF